MKEEEKQRERERLIKIFFRFGISNNGSVVRSTGIGRFPISKRFEARVIEEFEGIKSFSCERRARHF